MTSWSCSKKIQKYIFKILWNAWKTSLKIDNVYWNMLYKQILIKNATFKYFSWNSKSFHISSIKFKMHLTYSKHDFCMYSWACILGFRLIFDHYKSAWNFIAKFWFLVLGKIFQNFHILFLDPRMILVSLGVNDVGHNAPYLTMKFKLCHKNSNKAKKCIKSAGFCHNQNRWNYLIPWSIDNFWQWFHFF